MNQIIYLVRLSGTLCKHRPVVASGVPDTNWSSPCSFFSVTQIQHHREKLKTYHLQCSSCCYIFGTWWDRNGYYTVYILNGVMTTELRHRDVTATRWFVHGGQTFRFEAIDRSLSPIDRLKGSGEIGLSIAHSCFNAFQLSVSCNFTYRHRFILLTSRVLNKAIKLNAA